MKQNFCKLLAGTALALSGYTAQAQGLQGIIVEDYYTITAADKAYIDGLGGDPINVGTKVYRIYVDMAPNYKLNTVFGSPTGGSNNPLSISTTTSFWNDINNGTEVPTQTRFLDEGAAFDTYITIGRTGASGGAAGCGSNAAQVGVLKTADTNGNLTLCTNYSGWPVSGAGGNADGNIPGTSTALTYNVGGLVNLAPLTSTGNNFTVVGDAWATLPNSAGVDPAGTNRVLIGQFTTDGALSFHINVQLQQPTGGALESYVWNQAGAGEVVSPFLTYPQPVTGCSSSQSAYVKPLGLGNTTTSLLTTGDAIGGYQMVGIPDGLGAFDNGNGTFTLLMNHELGNTVGAVRAHGSIGSFVSKWVVNKSTLCMQSGADLMTTVKLWNGSAFVNSPGTAFNRFCSGDLPAASAFYNAGTGKGTQERIYMNGEEAGNEGRAMGHIVTGPNAGTSYQLPWLGRFSWENAVANPASGDKTVVAGTDDTTPGQVYVYIGNKTTTGTEIDKAGLNNGNLYGVRVTGLASDLEVSGSFPAANTPFTLVSLGNVSNLTGAQLQTNSVAAGITQFLRPEDASWDPSNPNDLYFVTTNAFTAPSRMWRLHFTDILNPQAGGTITAVLDGSEVAGQKMMDNITVDQLGHVYIQEDVGGNIHNGKIWQYDIATDALTQVAYHDSARFQTGGANFLTIDEEASGIIDMKDILGKGRFLMVDQAHYATNATLVEGGQLLEFATGDTIEPCVAATINSITGATTLCSLEQLALNVSASGTLPLTYAWSGTGSFAFGSSNPSALVDGSATGTYSVNVTNACGTATGNVLVTVNTAGTYYADTDGDGFGDAAVDSVACTQPTGYVANSTDDCPSVTGVIGSTCDDGNTLTINDALNASCVCAGTPVACVVNGDCNDSNPCTSDACVSNTCVYTPLPDLDGDGICDAQDNCPTFAGQQGDACNDNNACTINDVITAACVCAGTPDNTDTDGDGVADCADNCPTLAGQQGDACNDNNACTINDVISAACVCAGTTSPDTDGDGICDAQDNCPTLAGQQGDACNDFNTCTLNDVITAACVCAGTPNTTDTDLDGVVDCQDSCPFVAGQIGSSCDDGNANTINDVLNASCVCAGTPVGGCNQNEVTLTLTTDANGAQTSYDVVLTGTSTVVCSGAGYASSSTITATCCLPNGCYDLRVFDSAGDGIAAPGGYVLHDANNKRIIDNDGNGAAFTTSSESPLGFCVPLGTDALQASSCDVLTATSNTVLQATLNTAVTALYSPGTPTVNSLTGYQFWVTNPNGGFSRRILFTHAAPGTGWPTGTAAAQKASYFRLSAMTSPSAIPQGVLLNVRVRTRLNGTYSEFGPACRLLLPVPACQTTQLTSTATPVVSCGATGLSLTSTIYADAVAGATNYQFEFAKSGYLRRITQAVRSTALNFVTVPLQNNNCYQVRVRISVDGGATFCPFGPVCNITIGTATCGSAMAPQADENSNLDIAISAHLTIWPNPNDGSLVNVSLTEFSTEVGSVTMDVTDVYGKLVATRTIPVQDGTLNSKVSFEQDLAPGLYLVNLQAGDQRFTERLVIQ